MTYFINQQLMVGVLLASLALTTTACSSTQSQDNEAGELLRVSMQDTPNPYSSRPLTYAIIQSTSSDNITVNDININRGNCALLSRFKPVTLGYGQSTKVAISGCNTQDILEAEVDTDKGSASFSFN